MKKLIIIFFVLFIACNEESENPEPVPNKETKALREAAGFPVGVAVSTQKFNNPDYVNITSREFSSVTAEWEMKMKNIFTGPDQYDFSAADQIVAFAKEHKMQVHGHALVWHNSTPDWMFTYEATPEEWEMLIRDYIHTVVKRYKDDVISWDVVNEAFENNTGALRESVFYQKLGPQYLEKVYKWAREADDDCLLFYNDYNTPSDKKKRSAMLSMIDEFNNKGIPLDGVGLQLHIAYNWPPLQDIENTVNALLDRDMMIHFSEIDIKLNPDGNNTKYTAELGELQKQRMKSLVNLFTNIPVDKKFAITFWGLKDDESWLIKFRNRQDWPLLFDKNYYKKPMYYGFLEGLE